MAEPRSPIELSDGEEMEGENERRSPMAMVPFSPGSPTKRPKTGMIVTPSGIDQNELVGLIQTTIHDSIQSNFGVMQATVQTLAERTSVQEERMDRVEGLVQDLDQKHTRHFDSLRGELVELQKKLASPRASPPCSVSGSPSNADRSGENSFDIVLGGWKDGCTREWVETHVGKLLEAAQVTSLVSQVKAFGKRPAFAKIELKFDEGVTLASRREQQVSVLLKLKSVGWQPHDRPAWITTDKTIPQRRISKAVAVLNTFLTERLQVDRGVLEVASWPAAKSYVGEWRVTGLSEEHDLGAKPPCDVADLRWLVQDARSGMHVWLDLSSLAKGLQIDKAALHEHWLAHFGRADA